MKPVLRISISSPMVIDHDFFEFTNQIRYKEIDQYWWVKCTFTSFEGAQRVKEFKSLYKAKALYQAYDWLKEQKGMDDAIQRELKKKKDHRSPSYKTKMRLRQTVIRSTMGDARYRLSYRDVSHGNTLYFGYGDTPEEAYDNLVKSMCSVQGSTRRRNSDGVVIGSQTEWYSGPSKDKRWWQFWRS